MRTFAAKTYDFLGPRLVDSAFMFTWASFRYIFSCPITMRFAPNIFFVRLQVDLLSLSVAVFSSLLRSCTLRWHRLRLRTLVRLLFPVPEIYVSATALFSSLPSSFGRCRSPIVTLNVLNQWWTSEIAGIPFVLCTAGLVCAALNFFC